MHCFFLSQSSYITSFFTSFHCSHSSCCVQFEKYLKLVKIIVWFFSSQILRWYSGSGESSRCVWFVRTSETYIHSVALHSGLNTEKMCTLGKSYTVFLNRPKSIFFKIFLNGGALKRPAKWRKNFSKKTFSLLGT